MKLFSRMALLCALVALSLPAHAAGSVPVADALLVKSNATQQLAQRAETPAFFKKSKKEQKKKKKK